MGELRLYFVLFDSPINFFYKNVSAAYLFVACFEVFVIQERKYSEIDKFNWLYDQDVIVRKEGNTKIV